MKHYLTDADRLELKSKIVDSCYMLNNTSMVDTLVNLFSDFYAEKNTFTDAIREAQKPRIWKVLFRKEWVQCLLIMQKIGRPMTTVEVANALWQSAGVDPFKARDAARHLVDARHWNMVERTEDRVGNAHRYRLTSFGQAALRNPHATIIKRFLYTMHGNATPTPDGKDAPDMISFGSVFYVEKRTKEEHVHDSAALDEQRNPSLFVK